MKVLTAYGPNHADYSEVEKPVATGRNMVVKVMRAGICATDLSIFSGESSFVESGEIVYPVRFGHEWSGVVESVGEEVKNFKPGDRIFSDNGISCGVCEDCQKGNYAACQHIRSVGTVNCWDGCFAEYMLVPEYNAYKIPDGISYDDAALIEPASISIDAFEGVTITPDMTVAVIGIGAIGMGAIWLAKYFGAGKVIAIGRNNGKLQVANKVGADVLINTRETDVVAAVLAETDGGADLVIETSGAESALIEAMHMTRPDGRISIASFYEKNVSNIPIDNIVLRRITVAGAAGHFGNPERVAKIMAENPVKLTPIISHRVKFCDQLDVFKNIKEYSNSKIKIMVEFD